MKTVFTSALLLFTFTLFAQKGKQDTLSADQAKEVMSSINVDSAAILKESALNACKCIGKIKIKNKSSEEISGSVSKCIEKEVDSYSMTLQMMNTLKNLKLKDTIYINSSKQHDQFYFDLESWLRDSCSALSLILGADNKESEYSLSKNKSALKYYKKGQTAMTNEDYPEAIANFSEAVKQDKNFAFAWDNLGISLRKSGKNLEAIEAYNESLAIDPKGQTPLQNLPVVYNILKDYDKALEGYKNLIRIYPNDPEGYYGAGQTYLNGKKDLENALDYFCKAYNLYYKIGSPYRADTENIIGFIHSELKKQDKEEAFKRIIKLNNL